MSRAKAGAAKTKTKTGASTKRKTLTAALRVPTGKGPGRPSEATPETIAAICEVLRRPGATQRQAAAAAGISYRTLANWIRVVETCSPEECPEYLRPFATEYRQAVADASEALRERLIGYIDKRADAKAMLAWWGRLNPPDRDEAAASGGQDAERRYQQALFRRAERLAEMVGALRDRMPEAQRRWPELRRLEAELREMAAAGLGQ